MTTAEHKKRHQDLQRALDELVADFIAHGKLGEHLPNATPISHLMAWAADQANAPTEPGDHRSPTADIERLAHILPAFRETHAVYLRSCEISERILSVGRDLLLSPAAGELLGMVHEMGSAAARLQMFLLRLHNEDPRLIAMWRKACCRECGGAGCVMCQVSTT